MSSAITPRSAVTLLFVLDGVVFGSWAARIPDVSAQVQASPASLGTALLCVSLGALATMRATGALCDRFGAGLVGTVTAVLLCVSTVLPGLTSSVAQLCVALLVFGAVTGMVNVTINSMGVALEARSTTRLLPTLHAAFSFGGFGGSLAGGLAAAHLSPAVHLLAVACAGLLATSRVARTIMTADVWRPPERAATHPATEAPPRGVRSVLIALGAIAGCTAYGEGALSDWGVLHLSEDLGAPPMTAAAGYAGFSLAMAGGRLAGPRLIARMGETPLLVGGASVAAGGTLLAALSPLVGPALLGFVLVGLGLANLFPVAIGRAGALGGPRGVALASTIGYAGLLGGPPLIGFLAAGTSLPIALTTISILAALAGLLAIAVRHEQPAPLLRSPWYRAGVLARPVTWLVPVGLGLRTAAQHHTAALTTLDHRATAGGPSESPAPYPGLEFLLDRQRTT